MRALFVALLLGCQVCCAWSQEPEAADEAHGWTESPVTPLDRDHWSFQSLERPEVPPVPPGGWGRSPIDAFIYRELAELAAVPQPEADRATLVRRVTFDLTGLPPAPAELDAALQDARPDWYEQLVDRLLTSPRYGPRWSQFWLDLARYADTDGYEFDHERQEAWRYRDWVIAAADQDLPYDQFVLQQLAADQQYGSDHPAAVATAFCLSGPDMPDINSQDERKHALLNEMASTVAAVLLGLQMGCAQCHDHKYDPISQGDFYRLRAFFEPAVKLQRNQSVNLLQPAADPQAVTHVMLRGDWRAPGPAVEPAFPRVLCDPATVHTPPAAERARVALAEWMTAPEHPLTARVIANRVWQFHFGQGLCSTPSDFGLIGDSPTHPELLDWLATELMRDGWSLKRLHRRIVTSAVYRQAGFGRAAGDDKDDRNVSLDRERGAWWYAFYPARRLEAEALRDALLAVAGQLNERRGGPGVRPPLPDELQTTLLKGQWEPTAEVAEHRRRSIYLFARRNLRFPLLEAFDRPDPNQSCARRHQSTTATQSLTLLNSEFMLEMARHLAGQVCQETGTTEAAVRQAIRRAWGRAAAADEQQIALEFLRQQAQRLKQSGREPSELALPLPAPAELDPYSAAALTDLCLSLLGANEFLYID